jgi:Skp family chaperone for outer membrane proteins
MGYRSILTTQQYISAANTIDTTADVLDELLTTNGSRRSRTPADPG